MPETCITSSRSNTLANHPTNTDATPSASDSIELAGQQNYSVPPKKKMKVKLCLSFDFDISPARHMHPNANVFGLTLVPC